MAKITDCACGCGASIHWSEWLEIIVPDAPASLSYWKGMDAHHASIRLDPNRLRDLIRYLKSVYQGLLDE